MDRLRTVEPWLWPPLLMAVIFALSAQPHLSTGLGLVDLVGRKAAHVLLYAALCAAWWRALRTRAGLRPAVLGALALTLAYAISDEWHQTLVAGRSGSALDVAVDLAGALAGASVCLRLGSRASA